MIPPGKVRSKASSVVRRAAIAVLAVGCGTGHVCKFENSESLSVPAGAVCPTDASAVAAQLERRPGVISVAVRSLSDESPQPALTICWYRLVLVADLCEPGNDRRAYLSEAQALRSLVTADDQETEACDPDGYLLGKVMPAPKTAEDPEGLVPLDASSCPSEVTTRGANPEVLDVFLGADQYPARVICTYETSETSSCGGGRVPGLGPT